MIKLLFSSSLKTDFIRCIPNGIQINLNCIPNVSQVFKRENIGLKVLKLR